MADEQKIDTSVVGLDDNIASMSQGSGFTPAQQTVIDSMTRFTKAQNPNWTFSYSNSETSIPAGTFLDTQMDIYDSSEVVPLPSATVVTEQVHGQADTAGVAITYSRGDHTHGTSPIGAETYYSAASVNVVAGTPIGGSVVADLQTLHDGNVYQLQEVNATPGIDLRLTFTGVTSFNRFMVLAYYQGSTAHTVEIELYNNSTTAWDCFDTISHDSSNPTMEQFFGSVPDDTNYISGGTVIMRFDHPVNGVPSHNLYIDYAALVEVG